MAMKSASCITSQIIMHWPYSNLFLYYREIAAYIDLFESLIIIGKSLVENHNKFSHSSLFSEEGIYDNSIRKTMDSIKLESFYGRTLGFNVRKYFKVNRSPLKVILQLPKSLRKPTKQMACLMAMYSEYYYSSDSKALKFLRLPHVYIKYLFYEDFLSRRLVELFEHAESDYNNSLFTITETKIYKIYQDLTESKIRVNKKFFISPEPFKVYSKSLDNFVDISPPVSHVGWRPIACRLFSASRRKGMVSFTYFS